MNIWNNFSPVHANFMLLNLKWVTAELVRLNGWQDHSTLNSLHCMIIFLFRITSREKNISETFSPSGITLKLCHSYRKIQSIFMFKCTQFLNCHFFYFCRNGLIWSYCICFYFMNVLFPKWSDLQSNLG